MSEVEVVTPETETESALGTITIEVGEGSVSYDCNMTIPDMIFWLKVVEDLAVKKALGSD